MVTNSNFPPWLGYLETWSEAFSPERFLAIKKAPPLWHPFDLTRIFSVTPSNHPSSKCLPKCRVCCHCRLLLAKERSARSFSCGTKSMHPFVLLAKHACEVARTEECHWRSFQSQKPAPLSSPTPCAHLARRSNDIVRVQSPLEKW